LKDVKSSEQESCGRMIIKVPTSAQAMPEIDFEGDAEEASGSKPHWLLTAVIGVPLTGIRGS
jgi:hypothetical protein